MGSLFEVGLQYASMRLYAFVLWAHQGGPCHGAASAALSGLLWRLLQRHPRIRTPRRVARLVGPNTKDFFTAVTPHNPSISGLRHDHPSSVARQQRKKPDPWPPQATWGGTQNRAPRSTCSACAARSTGRATSFDASAASSERPLLFPLAGRAQAMWRHRPTRLQPNAH